jgi:hypothetical protein
VLDICAFVISTVVSTANGVEKSGLAALLHPDFSTRPRFRLRQETRGLTRNDKNKRIDYSKPVLKDYSNFFFFSLDIYDNKVREIL